LEDFSKKYEPKGFCNSLQKVQGKRKYGSSLVNNLNSLYFTNTGVSRICLGWRGLPFLPM